MIETFSSHHQKDYPDVKQAAYSHKGLWLSKRNSLEIQSASLVYNCFVTAELVIGQYEFVSSFTSASINQLGYHWACHERRLWHSVVANLFIHLSSRRPRANLKTAVSYFNDMILSLFCACTHIHSDAQMLSQKELIILFVPRNKSWCIIVSKAMVWIFIRSTCASAFREKSPQFSGQFVLEFSSRGRISAFLLFWKCRWQKREEVDPLEYIQTRSS